MSLSGGPSGLVWVLILVCSYGMVWYVLQIHVLLDVQKSSLILNNRDRPDGVTKTICKP